VENSGIPGFDQSEWRLPPFLVIDAQGSVVAHGLERDETLRVALEECQDYPAPLRVIETARVWTVDCDAGQIHERE
jgi:hypothetical protein